jgi:hypothetical protein
VPELWIETTGAYRGAARDTAPGTTALAAGVTVPRIAERTGSGRATPHAYVPDAGHGRRAAAQLPQRSATDPEAAVRPVRAPRGAARTRRRGGTGPRAPHRSPAGR